MTGSRRRLLLTGFSQPLLGVLPDGLQKTKPRFTRLFLFEDDEGFVDEIREQVQHLVLIDRVSLADELCGFQSPAAREDRKSTEKYSLSF